MILDSKSSYSGKNPISPLCGWRNNFAMIEMSNEESYREIKKSRGTSEDDTCILMVEESTTPCLQRGSFQSRREKFFSLCHTHTHKRGVHSTGAALKSDFDGKTRFCTRRKTFLCVPPLFQRRHKRSASLRP